MKDKFQIVFLVNVLLLLTLTFEVENLKAQELNCSVTVNDRQISGTSAEHISELAPAVERYLNENRWTDDRYEEHERIRCNIQILLTDVDGNSNFTAEAVITASRPIYNSNRQTTLMVISDSAWRFNFSRNKNLIFDYLQFDDLTSFLDFYAYIILGYDYDSFSDLGGSSHFNSALSVFEIAQNTGAQGWGRSIGAQRNRFGLINDITNPSYRDLRSAYYRYHRHGLDQFTQQEELARNEIVEAMDLIRENKRVTSNNYLFDIFFGTKYLEIVAALRDASPQVRTAAYNILSDADPANTSEYRRLLD